MHGLRHSNKHVCFTELSKYQNRGTCSKLYTLPKARVFELEVCTVMGTAGILW